MTITFDVVVCISIKVISNKLCLLNVCIAHTHIYLVFGLFLFSPLDNERGDMLEVVSESDVAMEIREPGLLRLQVDAGMRRVKRDEESVVPPMVVRVHEGQEIRRIEQNLQGRQLGYYVPRLLQEGVLALLLSTSV